MESDSPGVLAISARNLQKKYTSSPSPVLMGLDMEVEQGSIYGLLGPSGCGKTTLLKCIIGTDLKLKNFGADCLLAEEELKPVFFS